MTKLDYSHAKLSAEQAEFVGLFVRFEFALKEVGGFLSKNDDARVEWGTVAKGLGKDFFEAIRNSGRAQTTIRSPAKKQVSRDGRLGWQEGEPCKNTTQLIEAVRRVRNNLLHGGKSGDPEGERDRSAKLITEARWIVEQAIVRLESVQGYFEGRY